MKVSRNEFLKMLEDLPCDVEHDVTPQDRSSSGAPR